MQNIINTKADQATVRRLNMSAILKLLRKRGTLARAGLAKELGMTRNTASNIVSDLLGAGLVIETNFHREGAGRPGLLLELAPTGGFAIGVEIDISRVIAMVLDFKGSILWEESVQIVPSQPQDDIIATAEQLARRALDWGKGENLHPLGIGLGLAGLVDAEGGNLIYAPTLNWTEVPFKAMWEEKFDLPVYLDNEANSSALGYHAYADRYTSRNLAYLSIGGGMAAGLLLNQEIFRGSKGFAGQAGHMKIKADGEKCSCGGSGCLVTEVGIPALYRHLKKLTDTLDPNDQQRYQALIDTSIGSVDLEAASQLLQSGDEKLKTIVEGMGKELGMGVAIVANLFNLDKVVLGGAMRPILPFMVETTRKMASQQTLSPLFESVIVKVSDREDDSVFGAASMVLNAILNNPVPLVRLLI